MNIDTIHFDEQPVRVKIEILKEQKIVMDSKLEEINDILLLVQHHKNIIDQELTSLK